MKQVGTRRDPAIEMQASGRLLAEGARFNETVARLSPTTFIPKGVYHFRSHQEANLHEQECLARGMGRLAAKRA
ncbi:MAG: hypothetical protein IPJ21_09170 [Sterolibacteriaceae bacterium]|nr:hypothetical protein [Sterolibacteriaceae bacterium]MBK9084034.1 hypothetical protein [Sterolibacteriaceae bacterium]